MTCVGWSKKVFSELGKRADVSGTSKFYVRDSKSCIVNFCCCSFAGAFKGLRANFLPSSYFSINYLVRAGKILLKGGWSQAKKWNKQAFQMLIIKSTISFPNDIGAKSQKYIGRGYFSAPSVLNNKLLIILVNTSVNN